MKILIVEDDDITREGLTEIFETEGYDVVSGSNGREGLDLYRQESPDFICLDIMMPEVDGYEVCRQIRKTDATVPVIFISAKSEEIDKVVGLELGADDFIVKPFGVREVVARIRAVTRRYIASQAATEETRVFKMNDLEILPGELRARRGDAVFDLSIREVRMLRCLFENRGSVLDRETLFKAGWSEDFYPASRTLDQHISQLRKRIEKDPANPEIIRTVHGAGYRFE